MSRRHQGDDLVALAERVAETLDVGPGTRVFEVDCGRGEFLYPFHQNGYDVGGTDPDADAVAAAFAAMAGGIFQVANAAALDPAVPWHVVVWRPGASRDSAAEALAQADLMRGVLARMFAKATHAIAVLNVADEHRRSMLHVLAEVGASAVQIESASGTDDENASDRFHFFARV